jgi:hypothetical protein
MKEPCSQNLEGEGVGGRERNAANSTAQDMKAVDEKSEEDGQTRVSSGEAWCCESEATRRK